MAAFVVRSTMAGMRFRKLRIVFSAVCGILCVLLVVLWVRNFGARRHWPAPILELGNFAIYSTHGSVMAMRAPFVEYDPSGRNVDVSYFIPSRLQVTPYKGPAKPDMIRGGFCVAFWSRYIWAIQAPCWFLVALSATLAVAPWIRWRFSLRTLLITTMLVAVVLGIVVATN